MDELIAGLAGVEVDDQDAGVAGSGIDRHRCRNGRQPCGKWALPAVQVLVAAAAGFADSWAAGQ